MLAHAIEQRLRKLEIDVAELKTRLPEKLPSTLDLITGIFANDPVFEKAMKLGRKTKPIAATKKDHSKAASPARTRKNRP